MGGFSSWRRFSSERKWFLISRVISHQHCGQRRFRLVSNHAGKVYAGVLGQGRDTRIHIIAGRVGVSVSDGCFLKHKATAISIPSPPRTVGGAAGYSWH
jgi:hypothetical protein